MYLGVVELVPVKIEIDSAVVLPFPLVGVQVPLGLSHIVLKYFIFVC